MTSSKKYAPNTTFTITFYYKPINLLDEAQKFLQGGVKLLEVKPMEFAPSTLRQ